VLVPDDTPHIEACCAHCGHLFDLKFSTDCPACHHTGVRFAHLVTKEEEKARYGEAASSRLRTALDRAYPGRLDTLRSPSLTEDDLKDIAELDHIFALEDNR
jgi:hypothetical protein